MKTKVMMLAAIIIAAMSSPLEAGPHGGGGGFGGGFGGGHFGGGFGGARPGAGFARPGMAPSMHAMPMQRFGGHQMMYSGQRFSSVQTHSHYSAGSTGGFRSREVNRPNNGVGTRTARTSIATNRSRQALNGNNLRPNWRNHVFARHDAGWHRDWDRNREHWWDGHRCGFVDGSWVVFDVGFDPWWPYWSDYPYGYSGYPYPYSYYYEPDYYDSGIDDDQYNDQQTYTASLSPSVVTRVQQELATLGYYRGPIDGVLGDATEAALARYQEKHGLSVAGIITSGTLQAMGLQNLVNR